MTASNSSPVPQRRRNPEEKRERLIAAARDLFINQGFDETTTKQIAAHSGVSEGILFHQFGSKVGLLKELVFSFAQGAVSTWDGSVEWNSDVILRRLIAYIDKDIAAYSLILNHSALLRENGIPTIEELIVPEIEKSIRAIYRDESKLPVHPGIMARFQFSVVETACRGWLESRSKSKKEDFIREGARSMNALLIFRT